MANNRNPLVEGGIYHVFTKSIAGFVIFRNDSEYERMKSLLKYYRVKNTPLRFSAYLQIKDKSSFCNIHLKENEHLVEIIAYCLMPTHIHLILKQQQSNGISVFMSNVLNSYTRHFNNRTKRRGPLWQSRFKSVEVEADEQLMHLTRYIHLNPTTSNLAKKAEDWEYSSYNEFLGNVDDGDILCNYSAILDINPSKYKEFVSSRKDYQRGLAKIKDLYLE